MPDVWLVGTVVTGVVLSAAVVTMLRRREVPVVFDDEREERLTRRLARMVNCPLAAAVEAVRKEVDIAPDQSDETLLKRAAYHYRQSVPDGPCPVYRDRTRG